MTDISSEMVHRHPAVYLVPNLNLSLFVFGVIDRLYFGASALVRPISGYLADRTGKLKEVAVAGYTLSAVSRLGLLVVEARARSLS